MNYKQEYENLNNYKNNQLSYANKELFTGNLHHV